HGVLAEGLLILRARGECAGGVISGAEAAAEFEDELLSPGGVEEFLVAQGEADGAFRIAGEGGAVAADGLLGEEDSDAAERAAAIGAAGGGSIAVDSPIGVEVNQIRGPGEGVRHFAEKQNPVAGRGC